jgi:hypothetical protein
MLRVVPALLLLLLVGADLAAQVDRRLPLSLRVLVDTLLTSVDWRQRADAARRLGIAGDPRTLESLALAANSDESPQVRQASRQAIRQIQGAGWQPGPVVPPIGPIVPPVVDPNVTLINSWYERYLGRSVDPGALESMLNMLRRGDSHSQVQGVILGSDEFWVLGGRTPEGYVTRLFQTILGRNPDFRERGFWAGQLARNLRNRSLTAVQFLTEVQRGAIR